MRTTARNISQITKFISPSVFKLSLGTAIENRDIFMFPEPSLTLKKEQEGVASEEQVYNLISQIFNYDIKSRNLYFVKLEMRMLLQELKEAVNAVKGDRRELINNIYNETAEIVFHDGFINKNDYWNSRIENIKNKAETIINFNKQNHNQINSYSFKPYIKKPNFNLFEVQSFENVFNTAKNINNISVLGNSLFKPVKNIITSSQREPWQKDAYEFYNIYKSMDEKEKKEFLKSISMTEYDIVSVKRMTKEQWNVFLKNVLPHVSLYIKKSEDNINLQNYIQQNHNLSYVLDMTQNQWLNFKTALLNNTDNNLNSLKHFFKNAVEENNSFSKWEIEKKEFINFVYNNKYESFVNEAVKSAEFYKSQNNEFNQNNIYFSESETDEMSSKLTDWMTYLTESKWNEVKTVLTKSKETEYIKPVLEIIKSQKAEETEPEFSAEKRGVIEYIKNNKKLIVEILRELAEKDEIKKELTGWVDLKVLDKKTTEFNETARKNILNENIEVNKNSEEISPNSEVINNLSAQFTEWITYLTESQWNEVKTVLTTREETEYIKPVLEIIKSQKTEETEPEFSAEKRSVIEYIKNNKKLSVEILRELAEKDEIKKELTGWVDLKVLDKKTTEVNKTTLKNILNKNYEIDKNIKEISENSKVINNSSAQLTEWITYLTESQWNEVKTVLTANEETEYIKPVLEIIKSQKTEETEPEFSAEKRSVIEYIKNNKKLSVDILQRLSENEEIKKELINWVDLKELKNEEFRLNKSKITPKTDISGFYLNGKYITNASENLAKWLEYTTKSQWDDIKAFINTQQDNEYLNPVLSNVNIQTAENDENAFNEQKKEFIRQIVNNKEYASNFINLAVQNKGINDIITDLAKKTEINSLSKTEETYEIDNVEKVLTSNKAQRAKTNNETIKRILNWAYNTESNSEVKRQIRNKFVNEVRNEVKYDENILNSSYSTSNKFFEKIYKKRKEAIPQIMSQLYTAKDINSVYTNEKFNASMAQNGKYFSANLINRINSGSAENELSQYTTADLVIAKSNNVKGAVKNPVKMPDITTQVQQAVKTQVNDIIKINKSSEIQQSENKTIYELTRRINLQQKEIESIITNQRQMLKITDISVVAEKVMNQMQSQLRLEKMRRGL